MAIEVKVIEDSVSAAGNRLTTLQLKYPRFIHSELMTHRVFSRNASSSRAIPVAKVIEQVRNDPAMPIHWGANQPGMQADVELTGESLAEAERLWILGANDAANIAQQMLNLGLHKQVANRGLEPYQWIHVVVTATEWDNFFELRCHPDAQPEIHKLAVMMREAMRASLPYVLKEGDWHLPYVSQDERSDAQWEEDKSILMKISAARCARVSYLTHDNLAPIVAKDLELYERLVGSKPIHASPVEHQATPDYYDDFLECWNFSNLHGNFVGWIQQRKLLEQTFA